MKLATFSFNGARRLGAVEGDAIADLASADPGLGSDMLAFIEGGEAMLARARVALGDAPRLRLADVKLEAPIRRPPKVLAIGLNYADHIAETNAAVPAFPIVFNKQSTCIVGPGEGIVKPAVSDQVDYEAELCIVIGRRCRHVRQEEAAGVIFGFCIGNDVSVRDWQRRTPTMTMGKSFDTHGPIGPWITTADEVPDPHALDIACWVNDELRQNSNTRHLVTSCYEQIEHLSTAFTLEPGDVIFTGTPAGVGGAMKPPRFLAAGDRVRITIAGLGTLENPVVADTAASR
jgi:2-keto-4-pentenoate hydratase/2-oxohepta-3-ene-1,7-dioic acid hydratase in catechol pathway